MHNKRLCKKKFINTVECDNNNAFYVVLLTCSFTLFGISRFYSFISLKWLPKDMCHTCIHNIHIHKIHFTWHLIFYFKKNMYTWEYTWSLNTSKYICNHCMSLRSMCIKIYSTTYTLWWSHFPRNSISVYESVNKVNCRSCFMLLSLLHYCRNYEWWCQKNDK